MENIIKKPELLIPAGNLERLKIAFDYGADAVYIGGEKYGLREKADNFTISDIEEGVYYAHSKNKKVYIALNIFAHNNDIEGIKEYLTKIKSINVDALIVSDPGVFSLCKQIVPNIEVHISTQANNTNYETFLFWYSLGVRRVVAARELSLIELKQIKEKIPKDMEIEAFVHGAMCISYSGRCLLSSYFTGKDGNQGGCTHPCRWKYSIVEEKRPGDYLPIEEDERGTYIFNSKDLCMIEHIPEIIAAGIDCYKIEGRMKTALYVATVARTYRKAIDDYFDSPKKYMDNMQLYREEISACTFRQFTTGFYFEKPTHETQIYDNNVYISNYTYMGYINKLEIINKDEIQFEIIQKNKFSTNDILSIMSYTLEEQKYNIIIIKIQNEKQNLVDCAPHPKEKLLVTAKTIDFESESIKNGMILRKKQEWL